MTKKLLIGIAALLLAFNVFAQRLDGTMIRRAAADPCLVFDNGYFYLTMTGSSRLVLVKDRNLASLDVDVHPTLDNIFYDSAQDPSVEELFGPGAVINGTWSPEIHYFS
ncbi:MAG: hypothetical protein J5764_03325, partial [Bacteroidales bacterium]|nr:hypothetical protein [Bacteroidales bacterium]